ncbi:hypothetical protein DB31_3603 [Hyalangium minutum]|uniref:Uncharacterized protein n=1 Tax=Hyalangium minutum TaxID=394096 RepID=A0A085WUW0_9BACT|nr:hypothetical protein DB31_3603 [Hyalangium minutum]
MHLPQRAGTCMSHSLMRKMYQVFTACPSKPRESLALSVWREAWGV